MQHYLVDSRDVDFTLYEWLNIGQLAKNPRMQEVGFDEDVAKETLKTALKFAQERLASVWKEMDKAGVKFEDGKVTLPESVKKVFAEFTEAGLMALPANPEYGGFGMPSSLNIAAIEFATGANVAFGMYAELTFGAAHIFEKFGDEHMRKTYVEKMYAGQWCGTMCLTEAGAGSDVGALKTKAIPQGDGTYKIEGSKIFISGGDHDLAENIIHPVLARIEGAPAGIKGVSMFLVPKYLVNEDGSIGEFNDVNTGNVEHKMGIKGNATCVLNFGEGGNCKGWLVGEPNKGIVYMFQMMNEARLMVGMQGMAIAATAYMNALKYAKERVQFTHVRDMAKSDAPRVEIIEHPDVRRMLMHQKAVTEGMRALLYRTAFYIDMSTMAETDEEKEHYSDLVELLIPICKAFCSDEGFECTEHAIQTYGGYGFIAEYPVEQYMRDVKIASLYEGTNGIQALDLLGRKLPAKGGRMAMRYMQEYGKFLDALKGHRTLGGMHAKLERAQNELAQTVMGFQMSMKAEGNKMFVPILNATPFLEAMGHVTLSWLLCDQAIMAQDKLDAICDEKGTAKDDLAAVRKLAEENDDVKYYFGKVQSAKWYVENRLPHAFAIFETIGDADTSALDVVL
ncbi:MAG: acyl-CoA dehydrogenase [Deltaproteobacteria bacterium]|nr:acyl-CoA dehydrogenase [Deltaproteobacteria bacterium]MCB9478539.1 acyl-CoA dehydrogenase [Deltaproteobacteria bacterium]MCB9488380.1 acyl-CoA dehydrogenase [Deltaproteobacteria bacterium]